MSTYENYVNPIISGVLHHTNIVCSGNSHEGFYRTWAENQFPNGFVSIERDVSPVHTPDQDEHRIYIRVKLQVLGTGNSNTDRRSWTHLVGLLEDRLQNDNTLSGACCWITTTDVNYPSITEQGLAFWEGHVVLEAYHTW